MTHVVIRPARQFRASRDKWMATWGLRRDVLVCLLAVIVLSLLVLAVLTVLLVLRSVSTEQPSSVDVETVPLTSTNCGRVEGSIVDGAYVFLGIPYALPPIDRLRFKRTVPLTNTQDCWRGTYYAHVPRPLCFQPAIKHVDSVLFSEDCLYLDVYTPDLTYKDPMPVIVYFRGESIMGHDVDSIDLQPSAKLSREKRVVFVSVTYRVHAFGFMALNSLRQKSHDGSTSGNYGLYDMLTALRWVQMNVDSFGGNSRSVTVLGHGFGASAILALTMSSRASGLFNKAWISGGSVEITNLSLTQMEDLNLSFLEKIQCSNNRCLMTKPPEEIVAATPWLDVLDLPFNSETYRGFIVQDGNLVTQLHSRSVRRKKFNDVSLIMGATDYSIGDWSHLNVLNWTQVIDRVQIRLQTINKDLAHDAIAQYLLKDEPVSLQYTKMVADARVRCPIFQFARKAHNKFVNDVFVYTSSHRYTSRPRLDVASIFGQLAHFVAPPSEADLIYERDMQNVFYTYVKANRMGPIRGIIPPGFMDVSTRILAHEKIDPNCAVWLKNGIYPQFVKHD